MWDCVLYLFPHLSLCESIVFKSLGNNISLPCNAFLRKRHGMRFATVLHFKHLISIISRVAWSKEDLEYNVCRNGIKKEPFFFG